MKEQNGMEKNEKKKKRMSKERRFYLITGLSSAAALAAIVLIAVLVTTLGTTDVPTAGGNSSTGEPNSSVSGGNSGDVGDLEPDEPVITTPEGMQMPLTSVNVLHEYGFYHNTTLNNYYEHTGVDLTAEVGAEVLAVDDGVIESVYSGDVLTGTEITVDHGDGVKSVYRFVEAVEGLKAGVSVKKGEKIATVAEASGEEYKDGPHLHFEVLKSGQAVDPAGYLTFEEK